MPRLALAPAALVWLAGVVIETDATFHVRVIDPWVPALLLAPPAAPAP